MRKNILVAGVSLVALSIIFGLSYPYGLLFSLPVSILNVFLGLITRTSPGIEIQPAPAGIRLLIDRGVMRASVYQLVFLNSRLVFKRLSSVTVTVVLAFVLAIVGLEALGIIGALMGGVTGFSLQEFLTQRTRNKIESASQLATVGENDIAVEYSDLREVRLLRSRLYLTTGSITLSTSLPRGYANKVRSALKDILGTKLATEESAGTT